MSHFNNWCSGLIDPFTMDWITNEFSEAEHQREYELSQLKSFPPEELKKRWDNLNYKPKEIQLNLF